MHICPQNRPQVQFIPFTKRLMISSVSSTPPWPHNSTIPCGYNRALRSSLIDYMMTAYVQSQYELTPHCSTYRPDIFLLLYRYSDLGLPVTIHSHPPSGLHHYPFFVYFSHKYVSNTEPILNNHESIISFCHLSSQKKNSITFPLS